MSDQLILIIDDEPQMLKLLEINLTSNGYRVLTTQSGKEGIKLAANHQPDLILLDIGLPDLNGHEVLCELKTWFNKPIIILSVLNHEGDIVSALDHGALDYLNKPFRSAELLARIRSALRRSHSEASHTCLKFGDLEINLEHHTVKRENESIKLTNTEFKLLALMAKNEGRVLTHQYLLKEIWGIGSQEETQYLRVFVGTLRKKIEVDYHHPKHIITESGVGYRFI